MSNFQIGRKGILGLAPTYEELSRSEGLMTQNVLADRQF